MDRRKALKGLGLSLSYTIAAPSIMSLLQSCKTETEVWVPQFLSIEEGVVINKLVDLILPKTDATPGALDVNVPEFMDLYALKVYDEEAQLKFKKGINSIMKALNITLENKASNIKTEDYDALLAKYLRLPKSQQELYIETEDEENEEAILFNALFGLRDQTVWAYKTSELIGEQVLAYDPVPGVQMGCVSLEDTTNGKAWSL